MALPLSAARVPVRAAASRRTPGAGKRDPEFELLDTGVFDDDRYWVVEVHYAKADPIDVLMTVRVTNAGPDADTLHVLPHRWFRNTWSWDADGARPVLAATGAGRRASTTRSSASSSCSPGPAPDGTAPELLFCDNETNAARLYGVAGRAAVPQGRHQRPRRGRRADRQPASGAAPSARPGTG